MPKKPKNEHSTTVNGATVSVEDGPVTDEARRLFDQVVTDILNDNRTLFDTLSIHEKKLVLQWLAEAVVTGESKNALHDLLWELDFKKKPVDIETFIEDEYYLGRMGRDLHPLWKRDLKIVFDVNSPIFEWIMTGAIGIGKTTLAMISLAYCAYRLSCLHDPALYYGLLADSMLAIGLFSVTKRTVSDTGYSKLRGFFDTSPYFRYEFPRNSKIDSVIDFTTTGTNLKILAGSQDMHAIGLDVFAYAMDEANFMRVKKDKESGVMAGQAYDIYHAVYSRVLSRFMRPGGVIPGIMLLMSSKKAQSSFLEEHLKKVKHNTSTYISDYPLWAVKEKGKFGTKIFRVEVGDRMSQSRILGENDQPRKGAQVVEVPEALRKPFNEDVDQALRDHAGVATFNVSPLIRDRVSVTDAVRPNIPRPTDASVIVAGTEDDDFLEDYVIVDRICTIENGRFVPRLNPHAPRVVHLDLALRGDAAGFAMGHISGLVKVEKVRPDGIVSVRTEPFIVIDQMFRIEPPLSGEIDLSKIRAYIHFLKKFYNIIRVTVDGFQSADMIQILNKRYNPKKKKAKNKARNPANQNQFASLLSVDRTDAPYLSLRSALFDRRIAYYDYAILQRELLDLQRDIETAKVDHPERASDGTVGSKDVSDGVAGVVWNLLKDDRAIAHAELILPDVDAVSMGRDADPKERDLDAERDARVIAGRKVSWHELRANAE